MSPGAVGTTCKITYTCGVPGPEPGDLIRTSAGSCYEIEEVRESPSVLGRYRLKCIRLGKDAVQEGEPGVWPLYWERRPRRSA